MNSMTIVSPVVAPSASIHDFDPANYPSIFDDTDNVYNTYALPSEDPRKVVHYMQTGAGTPRALKKSRA